MHRGVNSRDLDLALERSGGLGPFGGQILAVATPRREELDEPQIVRAEDLLVEVSISQFDDVIDVAAL